MIPSLQPIFLVAEDISPPLLINCASVMHSPLKIAASLGEETLVAAQQGVNHHTHLHVKLNIPLEKKCGGRGAVTKPALCGCASV